MIYVVSGGGTKLFAAICVTYPAGSACTCTGNDKTWTAPDTAGQWVFAIPETGTYTVAAGGKSKVVTINAQGQGVFVNLSGIQLFSDGTDNTAVTGGWTATGNNVSASSVSIASGLLTFQNVAGASDNGQWYVGPKNKIELSDYNILRVQISSLGASNNQYIGIAASQTYAAIVGSDNKLTANTPGLYELDISALQGSFYVGFASYQNTANNYKATFALWELAN